MHIKVEKRFDALRRNFIWQGNKEKKSYNLVKWNNFTRSKSSGGLGIKIIEKPEQQPSQEVPNESLTGRIKIYGGK